MRPPGGKATRAKGAAKVAGSNVVRVRGNRQPVHRTGRGHFQARHALGQRMRAVREEVGMTTKELATYLGWPLADVEGVEAGKIGLSAGRQEDLARWITKMKTRRLLETPGPAAVKLVSINDGIVPAVRGRA